MGPRADTLYRLEFENLNNMVPLRVRPKSTYDEKNWTLLEDMKTSLI